jgi:hypothetical protein
MQSLACEKLRGTNTHGMLDGIQELGGMLNLSLLSVGLLRDFPFDRKGSGITDLFERLEVQGDVNLPLTQGDFGPPGLAWLIAPSCVFAMHAPHELANLAQRFDRLTCSVENHIRRIEIDIKVGTLGISDELQESICGFLACLKMDGLFIFRRVIA